MPTTTFATSGMVLAKVGIGYNTNLDGKAAAIVSSDFIVDLWIVEAEAYINMLTRNNYVDDWATLNTASRRLLQEIASSYAAVYAIQYDMSGFTSRQEAEAKINVLNNSVLRGIGLLKEQKAQDFL